MSELGREHDIQHELDMYAQAKHSRILQCMGHFWKKRGRKTLTLILEYADHGDLRQHIERQRQRFEEAHIWLLISQLAHGLAHLHSKGIVHRDIKSSNVLVFNANVTDVKIGDLGVSRRMSDDTIFLRSMYGTPLYASPEVLENKPYDEKTDIWSLGVLSYELAALAHPFSSDNIVSLAKTIERGKYDPLPKVYSTALHEIVAQMLSARPKDRPSALRVAQYADSQMDAFKASEAAAEHHAVSSTEGTVGGDQEARRGISPESKAPEGKNDSPAPPEAAKMSKRDRRLARRAQERKHKRRQMDGYERRPQTAAPAIRAITSAQKLKEQKSVPSDDKVPVSASRSRRKKVELAEAYRELAIRANERRSKSSAADCRSASRRPQTSVPRRKRPSPKHGRFNFITGTWISCAADIL